MRHEGEYDSGLRSIAKYIKQTLQSLDKLTDSLKGLDSRHYSTLKCITCNAKAYRWNKAGIVDRGEG